MTFDKVTAPSAEDSYRRSVAREHRDRFGQFFTPELLARSMAEWVLEGGAASIFDPAVGLGAFQDAAFALNPQVQLTGCEKDPVIAEALRQRGVSAHVDVAEADYFDAVLGPHEAVLCNPPYLRFQNFEGRVGHLKRLSAQLGVRLSGYTNAASAFLLKALNELKDGGRLAFVMPLEFLNTGYGREVKAILMARCSRLRFVRISDEGGVFPEVITSVGVVLLEKGVGLASIQFAKIDAADELRLGLAAIPANEVRVRPGIECEKWARFFNGSEQLALPGFVSLHEYGRFSRGIATGANEFFVASRKRIRELGLPDTVAVPCITRSAQISGVLFTRGALRELIEQGDAVFLLDLERAIDSPAVKAYIAHGESMGYAGRYLLKSRSPWYRLEKRETPQILFGVFSRGGFKVILNESGVGTLTPFHGFVPNVIGRQYLDHLWLYLNSDFGRRVIERQKRVYGAQLDKLEPNDLNQVLVPSPTMFDEIDRTAIQDAAESLRRNGLVDRRLEAALVRLSGRDVCTSEARGPAPMAFFA